jgi:hypothetical protein
VAGRTGQTVTDATSAINVGRALDDEFVFVADMQTMNGTDPSALRLADMRDGVARVFVEEETSADAETSHAAEQVGYLAMDEGLIYADSFLN